MSIPKNESLLLRRTRLRAARLSLISTKRAMEHPDLPSYLIDELLVEKAKTVRLIHRLEELIEQEQQLIPNEDNTHDKTPKRRNQHS